MAICLKTVLGTDFSMRWKKDKIYGLNNVTKWTHWGMALQPHLSPLYVHCTFCLVQRCCEKEQHASMTICVYSSVPVGGVCEFPPTWQQADWYAGDISEDTRLLYRYEGDSFERVEETDQGSDVTESTRGERKPGLLAVSETGGNRLGDSSSTTEIISLYMLW